MCVEQAAWTRRGVVRQRYALLSYPISVHLPACSAKWYMCMCSTLYRVLLCSRSPLGQCSCERSVRCVEITTMECRNQHHYHCHYITTRFHNHGGACSHRCSQQQAGPQPPSPPPPPAAIITSSTLCCAPSGPPTLQPCVSHHHHSPAVHPHQDLQRFNHVYMEKEEDAVIRLHQLAAAVDTPPRTSAAAHHLQSLLINLHGECWVHGGCMAGACLQSLLMNLHGGGCMVGAWWVYGGRLPAPTGMHAFVRPAGSTDVHAAS